VSGESRKIFCGFVREYLNSKTTLDEFNESIVSRCDKTFLEDKFVLDIYHALQHFEIDFGDDCTSELKKNSVDKLNRMIDSFEEVSPDAEIYLQEFFSLPQ